MTPPARYALLATLCLSGCRTPPTDTVTPSSRPGRSAAAKWAPEKRPWGTVGDPKPMPYDSEPDRRRAAARKAEAKDEAQEGTLRIGGLKSGQLQPAKSDARPKPAPVVDLGAGDEPARKPPVETPDL